MIWDDVMDERYMNIINIYEFDYEIIGLNLYCCLILEKVKLRVFKVENVVGK